MEPLAFGELALRPTEFRLLTPQEFFALYEGYLRRLSDQTEREARWISNLMNATGNYKPPVTVEGLLGRPLRANWDAAKHKRDPEIDARLAEKDAARRNANTREI